MSATLTEEQRAAVGARGQIIVSASAGSGKTFVMIERLAALIEAGADIGSVLCVTFTNKAAAQMRDRLRTALLERITKSRAEGNDGAYTHLREQLNNLSVADICTVHAFCGRLVRSRFYLAGVDPSFRIITPDDAEGNALSAQAMDEAFEEEYEHGGRDFENLLGVWFHKKKDIRLRGLVKTLYALSRESLDYRGTLSRVGRQDSFGEACRVIAQDIRERAAYYKNICKETRTLFPSNVRAIKVCDALEPACDELLSKTDLFDMVCLPLSAIPTMPPMTKAEGDELIALKRLSYANKQLKELYRGFADFSTREEEAARCVDAEERAAALAALALKYDECYTRLKQERSLLDYNDLQIYALKILDDAETVSELRQKYRYIFVDEYQDVNPVQEEIVTRLSGGDVFLVGDSKQAIYGFRGSRSEYFLRKETQFASLRLSKNFRSAEGVLSAVNRVFSELSPTYMPMTGDERYHGHAGGTYFHRIPKVEKQVKERGVYSVLENGGAEDTGVVADEVIRLIEGELGSEYYDADAGQTKRIRFGDIAVLVRKNSGDAEKIVRAASARGIPVTTSADVNVCDYFEVRLLLDWLSLLDNAEQDVPLATALLSAIGNMTNADLAKIRLRFPSPPTFREACTKYAKNMGDEVSKKLRGFGKVYQQLRALSRVRSAAEIIDTLLSRGLEIQIAAKGEVRGRLARVRRFVAEAGQDDLHTFLQRLKSNGYLVKFSESGGENAVKVYTMHASKGLEFPVVILANLDTAFHGAERDEVMWTEKFLAAPKSFDQSKKLVYENVLRRASALVQEKETRDEERNLLYVAMTRARYRLHMLFSDRAQEPPQFAGCLSDFIDLNKTADLFAQREEIAEPLPRRALRYLPDPNYQAEIEKIYKQPYAFLKSVGLPVKSSATELLHDKQSDDDILFTGAPKTEIFPGTPKTGIEQGLAYHAFLQHVHFGKSAEEELIRMRESGELTEDRLALLDLEQLNEILNIPCLKGLEDKRLWREQTFLAGLPAREMGLADTDDEIVFQGAVDLLVEDENGFLLIDYKFSALDDETLRKKYAIQIKLYRKAIARAMHVDEKSIRARIVNIALCREIVL